jgi:GGDEF domain-containing protein
LAQRKKTAFGYASPPRAERATKGIATVVRAADEALYQAKAGGRNRVFGVQLA